jgi:phenylacetate-coenzyme A ligase PaaK-like adenylate-forming protein
MSEHPIQPLRETLRFSEINKIENLEGRIDDIVDFIGTKIFFREVVVDQHLKVNVAKMYTTIVHSCRITSIRILHVNLDRHLL